MTKIKIYIKNFLQSIKRFYPKNHTSNTKYKLEKNQIYPQGKSLFLKSLENEILNTFKKHSFNLNKNISSIGTCFAEEFALFLYNSKFKYEIFEENRFMFQSNWGRVYTPKNLKQIIKYSLLKDYEIFTANGKKGFFDPVRDYSCGYYNSKDELIKNIKNHRKISRQVFLNTEFLFITLGQTEGWIDKKNNFMWGTAPVSMDNFYGDRKDFELKNFSINEISEDLNFSLETLKQFNNNIKIFLTLSPVPSHSTFGEKNVIVSSSVGKAKLRVIIDQAVKNFSDVEYFPSYENVILDNSNFQVDNRHVKTLKKYEIFKVFDRI